MTSALRPTGGYVSVDEIDSLTNYMKSHSLKSLDQIPGIRKYPVAAPHVYNRNFTGFNAYYVEQKFAKIGILNGKMGEIVLSTIISPMNYLNEREQKKVIKDKRYVLLSIEHGQLTLVEAHQKWFDKISKANAAQLIFKHSGNYYNPEQEETNLVGLNSQAYAVSVKAFTDSAISKFK